VLAAGPACCCQALLAKNPYTDLVFYQQFLLEPGGVEALDVYDLRGLFYSTSGACTDSERVQSPRICLLFASNSSAK
jgi:hypothetical protein